MRNFKKTLSFLLSTVIIVSSVAGVGTTVFAATDEHTYKNFKYRILDDNTAVLPIEVTGFESMLSGTVTTAFLPV